MRFKSAKIHAFRHFTDLEVKDVPESARLIVLAGPNGSGKSSFFDALTTWHGWVTGKNTSWDSDYHVKGGSPRRDRWNDDPSVELYDPQPENPKKAIYARTAHRNEAEFRIRNLTASQDPLDQVRVHRMIDNDVAVSHNYQELVAGTVEDVWVKRGSQSLDEYAAGILYDLGGALSRLFPSLVLDDLGHPLRNGTFRFSKGHSRGYVFKNLSGGEKAAFDLILDLIIARRSYDDTLFCIDEPEAHLHAHLQAELLSVLYDLIPDNCQLMVATHSIGMMRRAQAIEDENPRSVVFLDFGGRDFDQPQIITPVRPDRAFWKSAYSVALGDVAALVAPEQVVICEGAPSTDAQCYDRIFADEFPKTEFCSMGNDRDVINDRYELATTLPKLIAGVAVVRLLDRDGRSPEQIDKKRSDGIRVLGRRNLESCLFDDEVLRALASASGLDEKADELLAKKQEILDAVTDRAPDDLKPARGKIFSACKRILSLTQPGNNTAAFMRDTLAPLVKPGMTVYEELKRDIFGAATV